MTRIFHGLAGALLLMGVSVQSAAADKLVFSSRVLGNIANQVIAGEPSSAATWDIKKGTVKIFALGGERFLLTLAVKGLIIPALGFNPSPDVLARVVCHDENGDPSVVDQTKPADLSMRGNGRLADAIQLPDACFAPIVLIGGSVGPPPDFNQPSNWFAVSGF